MKTVTVLGYVAGIMYRGFEWLATENDLEAGGMSAMHGKKGHVAKIYKTEAQAEKRRQQLLAAWGEKHEPFTRPYVRESWTS
jgi:hypothetical protein